MKKLFLFSCLLSLQPAWAQKKPTCYDPVGFYQSPIEFKNESCITSFYSSSGCNQFTGPSFSEAQYNFVVHYSDAGKHDQNIKFYNANARVITAIYMGVTYYLTEFHFHSPSEHRFTGSGGKEFQMELHMVFRPQPDTNNGTPGIVIGVPILVPSSKKRTSFDSELQTLLKNRLYNGQRLTVPRELFTSCLTYRDKFPPSISYSGSLTTPPFGEGYSWIVVNGFAAQTAIISESTLNIFKNLRIGSDSIGRARPTQDLLTRPLISIIPQ